MTIKITQDDAMMLESEVFEAMGFASTCWTLPQQGTFESELALERGQELIKYILELFDAEIAEYGCVVCKRPITMSIFKNEKWCSELCKQAYIANVYPTINVAKFDETRKVNNA